MIQSLSNNIFFEILKHDNKYIYIYSYRKKCVIRVTFSQIKKIGYLLEIAPLDYWKSISCHKNNKVYIKRCYQLFINAIIHKGKKYERTF